MGIRHAHIDDVAPGPGERDTIWKPIRRHLGVRGFGVNAWVAREAGDRVIDSHVEAQDSPSGHEELYLVLEGRAEFEVDGETLDAPAGTLVFVPDPNSRRGAVARQAATTVLAVGAPAGAPFEVSRWERRHYGESD